MIAGRAFCQESAEPFRKITAVVNDSIQQPARRLFISRVPGGFGQLKETASRNGACHVINPLRFLRLPEITVGQTIRADILCMAVGLSPMTEMFFQAGCEMKFIPQLGGYVPRIDEYHRTTVKGLYAAGDAGGVEEATSAQLTGRIAALSAAQDLGAAKNFDEEYKALSAQLSELRAGPMGGKILSGLDRMKEEGCVDYAKA